ncbi:unnamed protein product [Amoebophrya sp. A25]|nr:unnamed protein product [Amoebophrya sp. A25]|eukprot:GSA25T00027492001.1
MTMRNMSSTPATTAEPQMKARKKKTTIYLIRHGDRFDYANANWKFDIVSHNHCPIDPPLSALGHQQARDTATEVIRDLLESHDKSQGKIQDVADASATAVAGKLLSEIVTAEQLRVLVSPYVRVIQTATPLVEQMYLKLTKVAESSIVSPRLCVEPGLAETTHVPGMPLQEPSERFAVFPYLDTQYKAFFAHTDFDVSSTHRHMKVRKIEQTSSTSTSTSTSTKAKSKRADWSFCDFGDAELAKEGFSPPECEGYPEPYMERLRKFAEMIKDTDSEFCGTTTVMYSHAASVALVGHLCEIGNLPEGTGPFAPCGIFKMERVEEEDATENGHDVSKKSKPFTLIRCGGDNTGHVKENAATTYPWMFRESHCKFWTDKYTKEPFNYSN